MIEHLFDCLICKYEVRDYTDRNGRERHLGLICRSCEKTYSDRAPQAGAFMDRRLACHVSAIANALSGRREAKDHPMTLPETRKIPMTRTVHELSVAKIKARRPGEALRTTGINEFLREIADQLDIEL